ncbi:Uncharacterized protein PBTT_05690 [Plasmodiophora brassicae]|uniref:Uncharacterized protein n=1 Tax=Plasmodiophora brassicae TaxID=37360 RepID=A0A0G4IPY6_PLABS|nr:hypothetical protein PBRA_000554 [Plasmodiophora brassicae]
MATTVVAFLFAAVAVLFVGCSAQLSAAGDKCTLPNGAYTCGANNAQGQATVIQCVGGVFIKVDDCDEAPSTSCTLINGLPFCVGAANANANANTNPNTNPIASVNINANVNTGTQGPAPSVAGNVAGAACTNPSGTYLCGANNAIGQASIVECVDGTLVKVDDCNDVPHTACKVINGLPFCV